MPDITCIAVDDEYFALELLENFIRRCPSLQLVAACNDADEAIHKIQKLRPQLLILDIQMPLLNGFGLLERLDYKPLVVFTTAYKQFALNAFEVDAVDYLVKPFAFERFDKAISKVMLQIQASEVSTISEPQLLVRTNRTTIKLSTNSILYIEKITDYVYIYTDTGRYLALFTLQKLEDTLPSKYFLRIHKSYIISLKKVTRWDSEFVYVSSVSLPIARARKTDVLRCLIQFNDSNSADAQ